MRMVAIPSDAVSRESSASRLRDLLRELREEIYNNLPLRAELFNETRLAFGTTLVPNMTTATAASDLFECYVFAAPR
jgi:hypothetical protein